MGSIWRLLVALVLVGVVFCLCLLLPGAWGVPVFLIFSLAMALWWVPRLPVPGEDDSNPPKSVPGDTTGSQAAQTAASPAGASAASEPAGGTTGSQAAQTAASPAGASADSEPTGGTAGSQAATTAASSTNTSGASQSAGGTAGSQAAETAAPSGSPSLDQRRILLLTILFADALMIVQAGIYWLLTKLSELYPWSLTGLERPVAVVAALLVVLPVAAVALALSSALVLSLGITELAQDASDPADKSAGSRLKAAGRALMLLLGLGQGTAVLDKGKLWRGKTVIESFRGPGMLEVRPGYAAVIHGSGPEPRVATAGSRSWLNKDETVTGIIDLHEQCVPIVLDHVLTKNAYLDALEFSIRYTVGWVQDESSSNRLYVNPVAAKNWLWDSDPESYKRRITTLAEAAACSILAQTELSEVVDEAGAGNRKLAQGIKDELVKSTGRECHIEAILVGKIKLPDAVEKAQIERYTKKLKQQAARASDRAGTATSPV